KVVRVDKQADTAFARVVCVPVAAVRGARDVLVLHYQTDVPPRPEEPEPASQPKGKKAAKGAEKAADKTAKPAEKAGEQKTDGQQTVAKGARSTADQQAAKAAP